MSLESQIADLVSATNILITTFNTKKSGIDTAVAAAIAAVPANKKIFYVHQISGLDTNDGGIAAPLRTIEKAIAMTPVGGVLSLRLLSDYTMASEISMEGIKMELRTDVIAQRRFLRPVYYKATDNLTTFISCFSTLMGSEFSFRDISIEMPSATAQNPVPMGGNNALIKANATSPATLLAVKMINCEVLDLAGATATLTSSSTSALLLAVTGTTFPAGFSGRYAAAIAAGTASTSVPYLVTNLPTL